MCFSGLLLSCASRPHSLDRPGSPLHRVFASGRLRTPCLATRSPCTALSRPHALPPSRPYTRWVSFLLGTKEVPGSAPLPPPDGVCFDRRRRAFLLLPCCITAPRPATHLSCPAHPPRPDGWIQDGFHKYGLRELALQHRYDASPSRRRKENNPPVHASRLASIVIMSLPSPLDSVSVERQDPSITPTEHPEVMAPLTNRPHIAVHALEKLTIHEEDGPGDALHIRQPRPQTPRSSTEPSPASLLQPYQSQRVRHRSPNAKPNLRLHSSPSATSGPLTAPPMARAHSSPSFATATSQYSFPASTGRPSSPLRSPRRVRSPLRSAMEEPYPSASHPTLFDIESISEDCELELTPRARADPVHILPLSHGHTFPRRRRSASPLHQVSSMPFGAASTPPSSQPSLPSSPLLSATKFNETYPSDLHYCRSFSSSSVPSTPTSLRSRSPSISSLETIPDSPDAEEAAVEAENLAKLQAAADAADSGDEGPRRSSLDMPRGRTVGFGFGSRDKRKRWSVCGAERRQDLDLETIWED